MPKSGRNKFFGKCTQIFSLKSFESFNFSNCVSFFSIFKQSRPDDVSDYVLPNYLSISLESTITHLAAKLSYPTLIGRTLFIPGGSLLGCYLILIMIFKEDFSAAAPAVIKEKIGKNKAKLLRKEEREKTKGKIKFF